MIIDYAQNVPAAHDGLTRGVDLEKSGKLRRWGGKGIGFVRNWKYGIICSLYGSNPSRCMYLPKLQQKYSSYSLNEM